MVKTLGLALLAVLMVGCVGTTADPNSTYRPPTINEHFVPQIWKDPVMHNTCYKWGDDLSCVSDD